MTVSYLNRNAWGAGDLKAGHRVSHSQFKGLVVHHTVMVLPDYDRDSIRAGDVEDMKRYMQMLQITRPDLGPEVPYSFVIFKGHDPADCVVAEGRGFGVTGAHTAGYNSTRYGVAYAGNASVEAITPGVFAGFNWIGQRLDGTPVATIGHRDTKATECPGNHLYAVLDRLQPPFIPDTEEDDMTDSEHKMLADINHRVAKVLVPAVTKLDQVLREVAALRDEVAELRTHVSD